MRTTILAALMLTMATAADAQGEREVEFGGGFHFWNLMQHYDFIDFPTGPTVDLTWVRWGERWGGALGVSGVLNRVDVHEGNYTVERRLPIYGHATVRYRFRPAGNGNVWSIGVGTPWTIFWERNRPRIWDSEGGYWKMDRRPEAVEGKLAVVTLLMHTEVLVTRQVSEQLKVRGGVRVAPFYYPLMLQPVVLGVWDF
ncbi:MAG: hypothetical protein F4X11_17710 [Acidobacteria bacterium]|nr:hypothetical protein [Acidobacteriota bacterium]